MKNIAIFGATGSIGMNSLQVIENLKDRFIPYAITAHKNLALLKDIIEKYNPKVVCITDKKQGDKFKPPKGIRFLRGIEGLVEIAKDKEIDIIINGLTGTQSIYPMLTAIKTGKRIALANKEIMVSYGNIIKDALKKNNALLIPVDSEHSAIYQCIYAGGVSAVKRLILTASGGPFLKKKIPAKVSPTEVLKHPVWKMGAKITVDSATLMNKGLEIIEAERLFDIPSSKIEVIIHPQSIIHSMVEFIDGSILAQLSVPDMKLPIQYALTYPERLPSLVKTLDLSRVGKLEFLKPDFDKFPALRLAYKACENGGTLPCVLNASNEVAVSLFLREKISLQRIPEIVESVMEKHKVIPSPTLKDIEESDKWAREEVKRSLKV